MQATVDLSYSTQLYRRSFNPQIKRKGKLENDYYFMTLRSQLNIKKAKETEKGNR